jgi:preprotein translocase subunit SecB
MSSTGSAPESLKSVSPALKLFPVKVQFVHLSKLSFEAREIPRNLSKEELAKATPGLLKVSVTAKVGETHATVNSTVSFLFRDGGPAEQPTEAAEGTRIAASSARDCYSLEICYVSGFSYDPKDISREDVQRWCEQGSFYVVMPYMRSMISHITSESGFSVVLLPLLEVPAFKPLNDGAARQEKL